MNTEHNLLHWYDDYVRKIGVSASPYSGLEMCRSLIMSTEILLDTLRSIEGRYEQGDDPMANYVRPLPLTAAEKGRVRRFISQAEVA